MNSVHRKLLVTSVSSLLLELGFDSAENGALETLTEMLQSFVTEVGNSSRACCELAGRTEPLVADVILALVNMGVDVSSIEAHAHRPAHSTVPAPLPSNPLKQLSILQAGVKQSHPPHIPTHLPPFPDPHAYIRTPTHKQPVTEYEAIREKSAAQKRDLERALNRFIAKTGETDSLFLSQDNIFPLIASKPNFPPYLNALLPKDQVFEFEEDESNRSPQRKKKDGIKEEEEANKAENDIIDNPYLRPVKLPPNKLKIKGLTQCTLTT
ncbi:transcription initiation factor TFIID subunit 8 [Nilaparvata lugens]|uniref:transcription initiation factor TFIID subunit 8 n=1 Tax=Nilaparvata lugens TaxID=108931 RepID=UPI000B998041|nr:transcription initiation factor TFIID subunit 8 [Nilaparvata lugens]